MASKKQLKLSTFIKDVHKKLRIQSKVMGEDEAWLHHCQQTQVLEEYAKNMHLLAEEFWQRRSCEDKDLCRIEWVVQRCVEYFYEGGLESALTKEEKLSHRYLKTLSLPQEMSRKPTTKLKLLDVGSCYNPFSNFSIFDVTAVDLMPATSDVLNCDFLSIQISSDSTLIKNPCFALPEQHFDVVVFSLLLEYLPSSKQRFTCCKNAYNVLKPNGVLFILTPDSKHASANAKVMKSWRYTLAWLGFWRVKYQKLKHLHCMCYRKCVLPGVPKAWLTEQCWESEGSPEQAMYIPQDSHDYQNSSSDDESLPVRSDADDKMLADSFLDLPNSDILN